MIPIGEWQGLKPIWPRYDATASPLLLMEMHMRAIVLCPLIALAACGPMDSRSDQQPSRPAMPVALTTVQQRIVDLPERQRFGVLLRAIRDGGAACQEVVQGIRQPDHDGGPLYAVRCGDGPQYAIAIDAKGVAQVTRLNPSAG